MNRSLLPSPLGEKAFGIYTFNDSLMNGRVANANGYRVKLNQSGILNVEKPAVVPNPVPKVAGFVFVQKLHLFH
jgi:hypothetical protein